MSPEFFTYKEFLAIQSHFRSPDYNYFFYRGRTKATEESFKKNKNYGLFCALTKKIDHKNITEFLACNFAYSSNGRMWISDLISLDAMNNYSKFLRYKESQSYLFEQDLKIISLKDDLKIPSFGSYPNIIVNTMNGKIFLESLCIINKCLDLIPIWNSKITEPYIWPLFRNRIMKFTPFLNINLNEAKKTLAKYV